MRSPVFAWILIVFGVVLALISGLANSLGLGQYPGFGWKKMLGVVIGGVLIVAGLYLRRRLESSG